MTARGWRWRDGGCEDGVGGGRRALLISQETVLYLLSAAVAMTTTTAAAVTALLPFSPFPPLSPLSFFPFTAFHTPLFSQLLLLLFFILPLPFCIFIPLPRLSLSLLPPFHPICFCTTNEKQSRRTDGSCVSPCFFFLQQRVRLCVPLAGFKLEITNGAPSPQTTKHSGISACWSFHYK